jgi:hypothetical protein
LGTRSKTPKAWHDYRSNQQTIHERRRRDIVFPDFVSPLQEFAFLAIASAMPLVPTLQRGNIMLNAPALIFCHCSEHLPLLFASNAGASTHPSPRWPTARRERGDESKRTVLLREMICKLSTHCNLNPLYRIHDNDPYLTIENIDVPDLIQCCAELICIVFPTKWIEIAAETVVIDCLQPLDEGLPIGDQSPCTKEICLFIKAER